MLKAIFKVHGGKRAFILWILKNLLVVLRIFLKKYLKSYPSWATGLSYSLASQNVLSYLLLLG